MGKNFSQGEKFGLSTQVSGSAVSIPSDIAEGSSRNSEKEYARYIELSPGSTYELETQLLIARQCTFGNQELLKNLLADVTDEQKMLMGFGKKLNG